MKWVERKIVGNCAPSIIGRKTFINLDCIVSITESSENSVFLDAISSRSIEIEGSFEEWKSLIIGNVKK